MSKRQGKRQDAGSPWRKLRRKNVGCAFSAGSKPEVQAGKKQPVPRDLRTGPTVSFAVDSCYCLCEVFVEAASRSRRLSSREAWLD
ncbi:hypothetical protein RB213_011173 [Colletotrichum asianum]